MFNSPISGDPMIARGFASINSNSVDIASGKVIGLMLVSIINGRKLKQGKKKSRKERAMVRETLN